MIDKFIEIFKYKNVDYLSNGNPPTFPDGFDVEIFKFSALEKSYLNRKIYMKKNM